MVRVEGVTKRFTTRHGKVTGAAGISFEVPSGSFFTLLGPSGCGKTTTMRCIAGLERPEEGEIWIGDRLVYARDKRVFVPASQRKIGMVFQSYALWPHMDVYNNVAFPLKVRRTPAKKVREKVTWALELVGLGEMIGRRVTELSGGQQQRVALARAVVSEVELLLLDEPLSNLDAKVRATVRKELKELQSRLGITTVYVTHDQEEALAISDVVAVVNQGKIIEMGAPQDLYKFPQKQFTAGFLGSTNFVEGEAAGPYGLKPDFGLARTELGPLAYVPAEEAPPANGKVVLSVRCETIQILREPAGHRENVLEGQVTRAVFLGSFFDYDVKVGGRLLQVHSRSAEAFSAGEKVYVHLPPRLCRAVRAD